MAHPRKFEKEFINFLQGMRKTSSASTTTIVVAMTEEQVRNMFVRRMKMRKLKVHHTASQI